MARNRYFEDEILVEKFNGKMIKRVFSFVKPYKKAFIGAFALMIIMGFIVLVPPYLNRYIVDSLLTESSRVNNYLAMAIVVMSAWALVAVSDVAYNFVRYRILSRTAYNMVRDIRQGLYLHLQGLSFDYYDSRPAGKILVRVTNYIDELANIFSATILNFIVDIIKMSLVLVWLYVINWKLALVVTVAVIPMGFILIFLQRQLHKRYRVFRNKNSNRTAYIAENIQGTQVTKAFNRAKLNVEIYDDLTDQVARGWFNIVKLNELLWPTMDFFWNLGTVGIYVLALFLGTQLGDGAMSTGLIISFIGYLGMFSSPLFNMANYIQQMSIASSNLERVFETLDTPPSIYDCPEAIEMPEIQGEIKFDNVTFAYDKGRNILENFNLDVPAGKMIALVGPTGGGKSTVVSLISRFYNVTDGKILIDGTDISTVKLHSLRAQVGVMMQDSFIFSGTVIDNIRYGRPDASDSQCIEAAIQAHCDEFIRAMTDGYYHKIAEKGAGLSSGQIQLLSFARTILCDPKILILDEATSSIDTTTEEQIQNALNTILVGRTSFVIAHRLSTIKKADCILYISDKGIQEAGTHEDLMSKKGLYYTLATKH